MLSAVGRRLSRADAGGAVAAPAGWHERASEIAPLLAHADDSFGGEAGVIAKVFEQVGERAGFAVEFGQRSFDAGTVTGLVAERGWGALYMDREPASELEVRDAANGSKLTLAAADVRPDNIAELFETHGVPADLDCLVIDIDGLDYWVWEAIGERWQPSLVIAEFNAHVDPAVAATIHADPEWSFSRDKDYGASMAALGELAAARGYRLIHVHGCWNLYFLREEIAFPAELTVRDPLAPAELELLTDTAGFYDALCGGDRPSWFEAPAPDVALSPWEILADAGETATVDLEGLALDVIADKHDASWYVQRGAFEEKGSRLYPLIAAAGFANFVDVGANAGLISILARRANGSLRSVAIEADPRLARLLRRNLARHGIDDADVVTAIAGEAESPAAAFSLNPVSSLDNRVSSEAGEEWDGVHVPVVRLDRVLATLGVSGPTFFKVDTQGFERQVLAGAEPWLAANPEWMLKMEFAPHWLGSQGTDPAELLAFLHERWEVAEFPSRLGYETASLAALFETPLDPDRSAGFLEHVIALDKRGRGWVDLIVRPRGSAIGGGA